MYARLEEKGCERGRDRMAFMIWVIVGIAFIILGLYARHSKKEVAFSFWANAKTFPVDDVRAYNKAVGKLWCIFGAAFAVTGVPLLGGQNSPLILFSILGAMFEVIATMVVYVTVIEKKYRKKD
jgi:uncharacterized integral membrane protein